MDPLKKCPWFFYDHVPILAGSKECLTIRAGQGKTTCLRCPHAAELKGKGKNEMLGPKSKCEKCGALIGNRWIAQHRKSCDGTAPAPKTKRPPGRPAGQRKTTPPIPNGRVFIVDTATLAGLIEFRNYIEGEIQKLMKEF